MYKQFSTFYQELRTLTSTQATIQSMGTSDFKADRSEPYGELNLLPTQRDINPILLYKEKDLFFPIRDFSLLFILKRKKIKHYV